MFKLPFRLSLSFLSTLFLTKFSFSRSIFSFFSIMFVLFPFFVLLKSSPFHNLIFPLGSVSLVASSHCSSSPSQYVHVHNPRHCPCLSLWLFSHCTSNFNLPLSSRPLHSPLPTEQHLSSKPPASLLMLAHSWKEDVEEKRCAHEGVLYSLTPV